LTKTLGFYHEFFAKKNFFLPKNSPKICRFATQSKPTVSKCKTEKWVGSPGLSSAERYAAVRQPVSIGGTEESSAGLLFPTQ